MQPTNIRALKQERILELTWPDGAVHRIPVLDADEERQVAQRYHDEEPDLTFDVTQERQCAAAAPGTTLVHRQEQQRDPRK